MGRKGVSKQKKAKVKNGAAAGSVASVMVRKAASQPEPVVEKAKASSKGNQKHSG